MVDFSKKVFRLYGTEAVKMLLRNFILLVPYNPKLELTLATDASSHGLGGVLLHILLQESERPIAYASRCLSKSEINHIQIDMKATAIK